MKYPFLLLIPLIPAVFIGFWCLVVKGLALAGWQRLATHYRVPALPPGPRFPVSDATVGGIRYRGALTASVTAEGLGLVTGFLFRIGHAPLLIPWAALGPIRSEKILWFTVHSTQVQLPDQSSVGLSFSGPALLDAARPWLRPE